MSEVRRTAGLALLDFRLDPTVVVVRPVLRTRFGARLVPLSTDGLASEKGLPGTETVADMTFRICCSRYVLSSRPGTNRPSHDVS